MKCWLCQIPVPDQTPPGYLVVEGLEVGRLCNRHATDLERVLRTVGAMRHLARIWIERRAAAAAAAAGKPAAAPAGRGL